MEPENRRQSVAGSPPRAGPVEGGLARVPLLWGGVAAGFLVLITLVLWRPSSGGVGPVMQPNTNSNRAHAAGVEGVQGGNGPGLKRPQIRAGTNTVTTPWQALKESLENGEGVKVPPEVAAAFVEKNRRSASSLLAAWQGTGDRAYLNEAAEKHPEDPRVQLMMATLYAEGSDEKRKWLDRMKESAPDNALGSFLSAADYFGNSNRVQGLQDLSDAVKKSRFDTSTGTSMQDFEELLIEAGEPALKARAVSVSSTLLPYLSKLKALGVAVGETRASYMEAGDTASAAATLDMGLNLANRLNPPEGGQTLIDSLVGAAVELIILNKMPPDELLPSGETVASRIQTRKEQRTAMKELAATSSTALENASEADMMNYFERFKSQGETAAMKWLINRTGTGAASPP